MSSLKFERLALRSEGFFGLLDLAVGRRLFHGFEINVESPAQPDRRTMQASAQAAAPREMKTMAPSLA